MSDSATNTSLDQSRNSAGTKPSELADKINQPVLSVESLVKHYGRVRAVDGLTFRVRPGELLALIGPNGAGKSTTYRCIVGLQRPDVGRILIEGEDIQLNRVQALSKLGYVGQDLEVFQYLTGQELLRLVGDLYELPRETTEERMEQLLALLSLESAATRLVRHYSGGMARKMSIATALLHRPPLLLLDESFAGLDPESTVAIQEQLDLLRAEGTAILLSSHVLDMLEGWVSRVIIMAGGRICADLEQDRLAEALEESSSLTSLYLAKTR